MQFFHLLFFLAFFLGITSAEDYSVKKSIELVEKVLAFAQRGERPASAQDFFEEFQKAVIGKEAQKLEDVVSKFDYDDEIWQKVSSVQSSPFLQPATAEYSFGDTPLEDVTKLLEMVDKLKKIEESTLTRFVELDAKQQEKMRGWAFWTKVTVWVGCGIAAPFTGGASLAAAPLINMAVSGVDVAQNIAKGNNVKATVGVVAMVASIVPGGGAVTDAIAETADGAIEVLSEGIGEIAGEVGGDVAADSAQDITQEVGKAVVKEATGHYVGNVRDTVVEKGAKKLGLRDREGFMETGVTAVAAFTAVAPRTAMKMKQVAKAIRKQRTENECYFKFNRVKVRKRTGKLPARLDALKSMLNEEKKEVETYTRLYNDVYLPAKKKDADKANALMDRIYLKGFSRCKTILSASVAHKDLLSASLATESKALKMLRKSKKMLQQSLQPNRGRD